MAQAIAQIEVTLAPSLVSILEAMQMFNVELERYGADEELLAAWTKCVETMVKNLRVAPEMPLRSCGMN